jgi:phage terminase large subunit GpA-like protein
MNFNDAEQQTEFGLIPNNTIAKTRLTIKPGNDFNDSFLTRTEYFKQLTAEQLVTRIVKGYPKRIWQKIRDRNEALDCRVYARAAAIALGIDRWSENKWEQLRNKNEKKY